MYEQDDDLEAAWGLIANAGGGNWDTQTPEWQDAAARWRDRVMPGLSKRAAARMNEELTIDALREELSRARQTVGFFASVIKSGESWTATCAQEYQRAMTPLAAVVIEELRVGDR